MSKILLVHNFYQQPGGEDYAFLAEADLLRSHGHDVREYVDDNRRLGQIGHTALGCGTVWSASSCRRLHNVLEKWQPDVTHFHNTFPLISPGAYWTCREAGVPVVQTLHNYRLVCPAGLLSRNGRPCEECLDTMAPWPGIVHACYRETRALTALVSVMLVTHRLLGTWAGKVDVYVALSEFAKRKFIQGGLPAERIVVKPNFVVSDPGPRCASGDYALFVGRLAREKGVRLLLNAWAMLRTLIPLHVVGDGPLRNELEAESSKKGNSQIRFLGKKERSEIFGLIKGARFLVFPSECYENFPLVIAEAFACGVPVIASRLGAMQEIVEEDRTGLHFTPGNAKELRDEVEWAWTHPEQLAEMGRAARAEYEVKYTAELNYARLMAIYSVVIGSRQVQENRLAVSLRSP
jgi:glycosyltransferase involved in cell wall biosynthesis